MLKAVSNQEAIDRGQRAERLINDPLLVEAFQSVRQAILDKIEHSPARDGEGREYLYKMLKALNDAKGNLEQALRDGKFALHLQDEKRRFFNFKGSP